MSKSRLIASFICLSQRKMYPPCGFPPFKNAREISHNVQKFGPELDAIITACSSKTTPFISRVHKRVVLTDVPWTPKTGTTVQKERNNGPTPKTGARVQKRNDGTKSRTKGTFTKTTLLQNRPLFLSILYTVNSNISRNHKNH